MSPHHRAATLAGRYDWSIGHARGLPLPPDAPCPKPTRFWPKENVALFERYSAWLLGGGACEYSTNVIYLPMAGHVLGLNPKPHGEIDLEVDLERAMDYVRAKGAGEHWLKACRHGLEKFRRFLRLERGLGEVRKATPYNIMQHTAGLPAWLVNELERFQRVQQRNWRVSRLEDNIQRFWSTHLRVWRFLCEERRVQQIIDLKRQDALDYVDHRLGKGYSVAGVNTELLSLLAFLHFLQDEGNPIPQSLLRIRSLKPLDSLPKYLTDEQVRLLRDDFERRVAEANQSNHRRDALLDRAIFYLLWQCGLRTCEIEELRLEDLELDGRKITIRDSKGRKDRTVYVTNSAIHALQGYLEVRGVGTGDHVFLYRNAPLKKLLIHRRIKAAGERVGVKVHSHRLRHTCATQLLNAGCRITSIQKFLGHKKLNTTMIYARALDQTVAEDYFTAMKEVEKRLEIPAPEPVSKDQTEIEKERTKIGMLVDQLALPGLGPSERMEYAAQLHQALSWIMVPPQQGYFLVWSNDHSP